MLRKTLIGLAASLALAAGSSSALAQVGTAFTYQGQLKNSGAAVNSPTDMQFSLWNDPVLSAPANQIGSTITQTNVTVNNGLFTTNIDFGVGPYTSYEGLWLQIAVRNPAGSGVYQPMGARQKLTPAPFSLATRGLDVDENGTVLVRTGNFGVPAGSLIGTHGGAMDTGGRLHIQSGDDGTADGLLLNPFPNGGDVWVGGGGSTNLIVNEKLGVGTASFNTNTRVQMEQPWVLNEFSTNLLLRQPIASWGLAAEFANYRYIQTQAGAPDFDGNFKQFNVGPGGVSIGFPNTPVYASSDAMYINGNVGIGLNNPQARLNVNSNGGTGAVRTTAIFTDGFTSTLRIAHPVANTVAIGGNTNHSFQLGRFENDNSNFFPTMTLTSNGNVRIGTTASSSFRLDVNGDIRCTSLTQSSSRDFKQDITPLCGGLDAIMKLNPVTYSWNDQAPEQVQGHRDIGFIADEMNEVLPDIVAKDESGKPVGIDYGKITPVAVEAIKQLKGENDQLKARLEKIEALLAAQATDAAK